MRLITLTLFTALTALVAAASSESPADTVITVKSPDKVTVTSIGQKTTVHITGRAGDPRFNYMYDVSSDTLDDAPTLTLSLPFTQTEEAAPRKGRHEIVAFKDMNIGLLLPANKPEGIAKGWEIGIERMIAYSYTPARSKASFSIGLGMRDRRWSMSEGYSLAADGDALIILPPVEGHTDVKASIQSAYITVPVTYTQRLSRSFGFMISATACFNVCTKASSAYTIGDTRYSTKIDGLHQRILTPEFTFTLGWVNNIGAYVRYCPVNFMKRCYGPQFTNTAIGISLGF
ncbi:MAG: hypothetical protein NC043_00305 [Muribaculaceae bacterium]|nr:hypothetical protein [Muribaculaceae bacterium]